MNRVSQVAFRARAAPPLKSASIVDECLDLEALFDDEKHSSTVNPYLCPHEHF